MRQTTVVEPEFLVETADVHHQRVSLPTAYRTAVIQGIIRVAVNLADMRTSVQIHDSPIAVASTEEHEDPIERWVFNKLKSVNLLVLTRASRRLAKEKHRIVFQETPLPVLIQVSGPFLERRDLVDIRDVFQEAIGIHRHIGVVLHHRRPAGIPPISGLTRRW